MSKKILTVGDVKKGAALPEPIYKEHQYSMYHSDGISYWSGDGYEIESLPNYYNDCTVDARRHDIHRVSNEKISVVEFSSFLSIEEAKRYHTSNTKRLADRAYWMFSNYEVILEKELSGEYKKTHDLLVSFIEVDITKRFISEEG